MITMVFTDLVNSTAIKARFPGQDITARNRAYMDTVLAPHRQRVESTLPAYGGRAVKTEGDAYFLVFGDAAQAAQWAVALQASHAREEIATPLGALQVKIGMHTGSPLTDGDDFIGQEVDYAARIAALAGGGQVVLSEAAAVLVKDAGIADVDLHPHGERELKGIGRVPVFELLYAGRAPRPLKEPITVLTNLPLPPGPFIGRGEEIAEWGDLLAGQGTRLLTLAGFGGMGKTRAALQLARRCVEVHAEEYPDGVWWVDLAEVRSGAAMVERIAVALSLRLEPNEPVNIPLQRFLRDRRLLLVLDNLEQIPNGADVVNELLGAAPHLQVVLTSRRALGLRMEQVKELLPLPPADAETLFVKRAHAGDGSFAVTADNATDVGELCRRLEGVPLAIELAASRIVVMAPRDMLQRLQERFRLLQTRAPDSPPRQRALRTTIDWSYELLAEEDRALFAQLAVFAGGFTMEDAEAVCEAADVWEGITELRRQSLLRSETDAASGEARLLMLETLREYAAEKLKGVPDVETAVRERHAAHFLRFAQERLARLRTPDEAAALRQIDAHLDNLRSALDTCAAAGADERCAEIALALGRFLQRRGLQTEALRHIRMGLDAARRLPGEPARLLAPLLRERAALRLDQFEWADARREAEEALAYYGRLSDVAGTADVTNLLGLAALGEEDAAAARDLFASASEQFRRAGDPVSVAMACNNLGLAEYQDTNGNREEAARWLQEALRLRRVHGDRRGLAETIANLGALAQEQGDLEGAWNHYQEALQLEAGLPHAYGVAMALSNLGEVAGLRGDAERACRLLAAAEALFDQAGSPYREYTAELLGRALSKLDGDAASPQFREPVKGRSLDSLIAWALDHEARP